MTRGWAVGAAELGAAASLHPVAHAEPARKGLTGGCILKPAWRTSLVRGCRDGFVLY